MHSVILLAVSLRLWAVLAAPGFAAEDAYITYRYSERIAAGQGFTFNDGEHVLGTTTPLFTLILVPVAALHWDLALILFSQFLGIGFDIASIWLVNLIVTAEIPEQVTSARYLLFPGLGLLAMATYGPLVVDGINGMETSLFIFLMFLSLYLIVRRRLILSGVALALVILTRPDGLIWVVTLLLVYALLKREWLQAVKLVSASLAAYIPWGLFAIIYFGSLIPQTISAKSGYAPEHLLQIDRVAWHVIWFYPTKVTGGIWNYIDSAGRVDFAGLLPFLAPIVLALAGGLVYFIRHRSLLCVWPAFFIVYVYALAVGDAPFFLRYLHPGLVALSLTGAAGVTLGIEYLYVRMPKWVIPVTALIATLLLIWTSVSFINKYMTTDIPRNTDYRLLGIWLAANTEPDDHILLEPLGYAGYYSRRTMHDLPGLVSPAVLEYRSSMGHYGWMLQYIEDYQVDVVVLRPSEFTNYLTRNGWDDEFLLEFQPVYSVVTDGLTIYTRVNTTESQAP